MNRILSKEEWFRRRKIKNTVLLTTAIMLFVAIVIIAVLILCKVFGFIGSHKIESLDIKLSNGMEIQRLYLTPNEYSRPQKPLRKVRGVVVHYTANPGASALNNRNYFEGLAVKKTTYASSHYIIGIQGEIIQCIPLTEISYASNNRNSDTISIECCHPDATGKFSEATYDSLVALTAALCKTFDIDEKDIIRHYDVTHKNCPLYYVKHEDEWLAFRKEVMEEVKLLASSTER